MHTGLSIGSLFLEGLLSFFSPCVLPLVPLYVSYLTRDIKVEDENGNVTYPRKKTLLVTLAFVLGICTVFVIAGLSSELLRTFFQQNRILFQMISGMFLLVMGLVSLNVIQIPLLEKLQFRQTAASGTVTFVKAWAMGFFFSFAWSPCVGPLLANAIVQAASQESSLTGWICIGAYALGFILIFLLLGLFTSEVLRFLKEKKNLVRYTGKIAGGVILVMGFYALQTAAKEVRSLQNGVNTAAVQSETDENALDIEKFNFTLRDKDGKTVSLSDYKGKTIVVNFFGTWCTYCNEEMPHLQKIHETDPDVQILLIATPDNGSEGDIAYVEKYMQEKGYTMKILYDTDLSVTYKYGVQGYPTTFIVKPDGSFYGYIPGYVPDEAMDEYLEEAKNI